MSRYRKVSDPHIIKALANPLRLRILRHLEDHVASPSMLAEVFGTTVGTARSHVRTLQRLGVIEVVKQARRRGSVEHHYYAPKRILCADEALEKMPPIVRTAATMASLQVVGAQVQTAAARGAFRSEDAYVARERIVLTPEAWTQLAQRMRELQDELLKLEAKQEARADRIDHADERRLSVVMMLYPASLEDEDSEAEDPEADGLPPLAADEGLPPAPRERLRFDILYAVTVVAEVVSAAPTLSQIAEELWERDIEHARSMLGAAVDDGQLQIIGHDEAGDPCYQLTPEGERALADGANDPANWA